MDPTANSILEAFFQRSGGRESSHPLVRHQIESFNDFIQRKIFQVIQGFHPVTIQTVYNATRGDFEQKLHISFLNPTVSKPIYQKQDGSQQVMTPNMARLNNLTYAANLHVDLYLVSEVMNSDGVVVRDEKTIRGICIGKIPIMVKSAACILTQAPQLAISPDAAAVHEECRNDTGGYFIVHGNEKVVISQDRISENQCLIFPPNSISDGLTAEIRCVPDTTFTPPKTASLHLNGKPNHLGHVIRLNAHYLKTDIPLFVMFRALGVESDQDILRYILLDLDDSKNVRMKESLMASLEDGAEIHTQEEALHYLSRHVSISGTPKEYMEQPERMREILMNMLRRDFLQQTEPGFKRKALYLGYMTRKLLRVHLGYQDYDNRDSYIHKRIDTPGILMANLFRQSFAKLIKEMRALIQKEVNAWKQTAHAPSLVHLVHMANIHKFLKTNVIESGLRYALSTGNWGVKSVSSFGTVRQGVAQVLNRMSYLSMMSHLRRINTPMEKSGKLVQPRKLDNSQYGTICPAETPEGSSVGLVKNMAITTHITVATSSQYLRAKVKEYGTYLLNDDLTLEETRAFLTEMGRPSSVVMFINGDLVGYHTAPVQIYKALKALKYTGAISPTTSIAWNIKEGFLNMSTEGGRMCRPLHVVSPSTRTLKCHALGFGPKLQELPFDAYLGGTTYEHGEGFLEYLDVEELDHAMIAMQAKDLQKPGKGYSLPAQYTHCEIHPATAYGVLAATVPFMNHNQSPRVCYQCIWEEEPVWMADGTQRKIKDLCVGDEILTFDPETKTTSRTEVVGHHVGPTDKRLVSITTISGRKIIATEDHVFMTNEGWKASKDFTSDTKIGIMLNPEPIDAISVEDYVILTEETMFAKLRAFQVSEKLARRHVEICKKAGLLPLHSTNTKVLTILARIAGYILTDGSLNVYDKNPQVQANFSTPQDATMFEDDVSYVGFRGLPWREGAFPSLLVALDISTGKKTENPRKPIPEWIMNGHRSVKREFLSSFQGGDGCQIRWNKMIGDHYNYVCAETSQQIAPEFMETLTFFMNQVVSLMREFEIEVSDVKTMPVKDCADRIIVAYKISDKQANLVRYYKNIGYRYDTHKITLSGTVAHFLEWKALGQKRTMEQWLEQVDVIGHAIFIPCQLKAEKNCLIADLETKSKNHSFLTSSGFMAHNSAMGKQAVGVFATNFNQRFDTMSHVLHYPQRPLVQTQLSKALHGDEMGAGANCIVAIMTYSGFNQEDSVMVNKAALDRGLFCSTYYKTFRENCAKNHSTGEEEFFCKPDPNTVMNMKPYNYDKLGPDGMIPKDTYVDQGDILVGKQMPSKINGKQHMRDTSLPMKPNETGWVDRTYTGTNADGYQFVKIRMREYRKPQVGDKLASKIAQKGTIGMIYDQQDMPFTKDGIVPDVIMNPHAIPSRMTIGQLIETLLGKAAAATGTTADASPFQQVDTQDIGRILAEYGYERHGNEVLYNGRTGQQIHTDIFIGPCYYQRLKHMVQDKSHCLKMDHEVLTRTGWKFHHELTREDEIATLKNGKLVYEKPIDILYFPSYKGKMYSVTTPRVDLNVTINHRMWARECSDSTPYGFHKAEDIYQRGNPMAYQKCAIWDVQEYPMPDAEIQSAATEHALPEWVWRLSQRQTRIFLNSMEINALRMDAIMQLAIHAGWSADFDKETNQVHLIKDVENYPTCSPCNAEVYDFEGPVFCLQVPSEVFMVRRNGKAVWTGNSRGSNGPVILLTRQPAEGRARNGGLRFGEMERDAIISHGAATFLKERMMDVSDNYRVFTCRTCGMICTANPDKNIYKCGHCKNNADYAQVRIPYACKLLFQELECMGIAPRMCL